MNCVRGSSCALRASRRSDWDMGRGLCVPAMCRPDDALLCRPLSSPGLSPASPVLRADPTSPRGALPLRLPLGSAPGAGRPGDGRISRVPYAFRPCVPTAEAPVDAGPLSPWRAVAAAFPAVVYGSASTVKGISGLVPFSPACGCGFRPTGFLSTLRLAGYPTETQDSVPAPEWLAPEPVGLSTPLHQRRSPTGKRRLCPAHPTSPTTRPQRHIPIVSRGHQCGVPPAGDHRTLRRKAAIHHSKQPPREHPR